MAVYDFLDLLLNECSASVFDFATGQEVFKGDTDDIKNKYGDFNLASWEHYNGEIIINIDSSEG